MKAMMKNERLLNNRFEHIYTVVYTLSFFLNVYIIKIHTRTYAHNHDHKDSKGNLATQTFSLLFVATTKSESKATTP
jgi:hypothetical protein